MQNNVIYINENIDKYRRDLEETCINCIDEETSLFFKSCFKTASAFSMMVAKDAKSYSKETFESVVVSPAEIKELVERINGRISREIDLEEGLSVQVEPDVNIGGSFVYDHVIDRRIHDYTISNKITAVSESVIGNAFSFIIGDAFSSNIVDYLFSKAKIGEKILGENNRYSRADRFQKELLGHIEGLLINMKTKLKNDLAAEWIRFIKAEAADMPAVV